jgi:hypothetical protein
MIPHDHDELVLDDGDEATTKMMATTEATERAIDDDVIPVFDFTVIGIVIGEPRLSFQCWFGGGRSW